MTQHRWITSSLSGRWCSSVDEALFDALRAGQAVQKSDQDQDQEIVLRDFATIEYRAIRSQHSAETGNPLFARAD
jgi:hypothetical protein